MNFCHKTVLQLPKVLYLNKHSFHGGCGRAMLEQPNPAYHQLKVLIDYTTKYKLIGEGPRFKIHSKQASSARGDKTASGFEDVPAVQDLVPEIL